MKKSAIHENADANITCNFGDRDISRLGVAYLTHVIHRYIASWIIVRCIPVGVCLFLCPYVPNVYNDDCRVVGVVWSAGQRPIRPHHHSRVS